MRSGIKEFFERCCISPEGASTICWFFVIALMAVFLCHHNSWPFFCLLGFVIYTFRNPKRQVAHLANEIYSPADGRIADIEEAKGEQSRLNAKVS